MKPIIGITCDLVEPDPTRPPKADCSIAYARRIAEAGGTPLLLPPVPGLEREHAAICRGVVFTGGDDPRTEPFGAPTHPAAKPVHPIRQEYETALLEHLAGERPRTPVLGVCLGMQMMALHAGGRLNQHMPETLATAAGHRGVHAVEGRAGALSLPRGMVWSNHHQAVDDPGRLRVAATSDDGVIEAVFGPGRPFYWGVQWHPERTDDPALGRGVFAALVAACTEPA